MGQARPKFRSFYDWLWLALGLACLVIGLWRSLARGSSYGTMIDQFHWSQLEQAVVHDGDSISLAGYMLPLPDAKLGAKQKITKFILVPYLPSCTQRPPPLANQTVLVETEPIDFSNDPVIVRGSIKQQKGTAAGAGYEMQAHGLRPWSHGQFAQKDDD